MFRKTVQQRSLFAEATAARKSVDESVAESEIRMVTFNLQNPSLERALKQIDFLLEIESNVLVLTEGKHSKGCAAIVDALVDCGFDVVFPEEEESNDYISIIATKGFATQTIEFPMPYLANRLSSVRIETFLGAIDLIGAYVPAANPFDSSKDEKKAKFHTDLIHTLRDYLSENGESSLILCGDLNVLEPEHKPLNIGYCKWEYFYTELLQLNLQDAFKKCNPHVMDHSWFGRDGKERLDHFFVSKSLGTHIGDCYYYHKPREDKLSDHSAMFLLF